MGLWNNLCSTRHYITDLFDGVYHYVTSLPPQVVTGRVFATLSGLKTVFGEFGESQNVVYGAFAYFLQRAGHDGDGVRARINVKIPTKR